MILFKGFFYFFLVGGLVLVGCWVFCLVFGDGSFCLVANLDKGKISWRH